MQILYVASSFFTGVRSTSILRSRRARNVPVPKLHQFHPLAFPLRNSTSTHAPLAIPFSQPCRAFVNMDKEGRLSPMRRAASRWNTLSNSDQFPLHFSCGMSAFMIAVASFPIVYFTSLDDTTVLSTHTHAHHSTQSHAGSHVSCALSSVLPRPEFFKYSRDSHAGFGLVGVGNRLS